MSLKEQISTSTQKKSRITILDSFEQMNESDIQEMAATSPYERIKNTVDLTLRAYGVTRAQLSKRGRATRVEITRNE
ncbi:MAG: hypothetical protein RIG68_25575 [Imperialibacter sp.]|uniref:hypothetical protein n=1 Tax=Imperialibacter sp. TaxID=2038411 RepID=UPI0032EEAA96